MWFEQYRIEKMIKIFERLRCSGLKTLQIIDVIKRFVLPKRDYTMMNSVVSKTKFANIDKFIRSIITDLVGGPSLSKDLFYTVCKNGGLGLETLSEKYSACKFNIVARFFLREGET
jgi:hypothetical protein